MISLQKVFRVNVEFGIKLPIEITGEYRFAIHTLHRVHQQHVRFDDFAVADKKKTGRRARSR